MGVTTYPCPRCSQQQREEHENGKEIARKLCAACLETLVLLETEILTRDDSKAKKEKAIETLYQAYGLEKPEVVQAL